MRVDYIKEMAFFHKFSLNDVEKASSFAKEKILKKGSFIFMEGDSGDQFYIIMSGSVEISRFNHANVKLHITRGKLSVFSNSWILVLSPL